MGVPIPKVDVAFCVGGITNGATQSGLIDTLDCSYMQLAVVTSTSNNTTNNPATLKLTECDTSNGSFAAITALTGDGVGGFTIGIANATDPNVALLCVDLRGRKRWLQVDISPVTTMDVVAVAFLTRNDEMPNSITKAGVHTLVEG